MFPTLSWSSNCQTSWVVVTPHCYVVNIANSSGCVTTAFSWSIRPLVSHCHNEWSRAASKTAAATNLVIIKKTRLYSSKKKISLVYHETFLRRLIKISLTILSVIRGCLGVKIFWLIVNIHVFLLLLVIIFIVMLGRSFLSWKKDHYHVHFCGRKLVWLRYLGEFYDTSHLEVGIAKQYLS